jgi:hypothetical protein
MRHPSDRRWETRPSAFRRQKTPERLFFASLEIRTTPSPCPGIDRLIPYTGRRTSARKRAGMDLPTRIVAILQHQPCRGH